MKYNEHAIERVENFILHQTKFWTSEQLNTACFYMLTRIEPWWDVGSAEWLSCWEEAKRLAKPETIN